jgi:hypothetical protein
MNERWEYHYEILPSVEERDALLNRLNELGQDGWELCHMEGGVRRGPTFTILKRRVL